MVGIGENTMFWMDHWVGESAFKESFPRLYDLCTDKFCSVASAGEWIDDRWEWRVGWRRELRGWESDSSNALIDLLKCRNVALNETDKWIWQPESSGAFSVRSSYSTLLERKFDFAKDSNEICRLVWGNLAGSKMQATTWRIIFRRIATRSELRKRGAILPNAGILCPLCDGVEETVDHLFVECRRSWELWSGCLDWLGFKAMLSNKVHENLLQFCSLVTSKKEKMLLASVWVCSAWMIWRQRNEVVFNNGVWKVEKMFGEIKSHVWSWIMAKIPDRRKMQKFSSWCSNPMLCCRCF